MGAVIKVEGDVRKTVTPSDTSCQPQGDRWGAGGRDGRAVGDCCFTGTAGVAIDKESGLKVRGGVLGIMMGDGAGCEDVGTAESDVDDGSRAKVGNAVEPGAGGGVNVGTPNAGKCLKVETVLFDSGGVVGTT